MTKQDQIDQYIREHGVTRCPAACVAPTNARPSADDVAILHARSLDHVGEGWRRKRANGWARYWQIKRAAQET